jgi:hypothetical protein
MSTLIRFSAVELCAFPTARNNATTAKAGSIALYDCFICNLTQSIMAGLPRHELPMLEDGPPKACLKGLRPAAGHPAKWQMARTSGASHQVLLAASC